MGSFLWERSCRRDGCWLFNQSPSNVWDINFNIVCTWDLSGTQFVGVTVAVGDGVAATTGKETATGTGGDDLAGIFVSSEEKESSSGGVGKVKTANDR